MKKWVLAILVGSALVLAACGGGDDNGASNDGGETASVAETVYESNCAACHGGNLGGGGGPALATIGADYSSEELNDIITNGEGNMPAFGGRLSEDEIQELSDWLAAKK